MNWSGQVQRLHVLRVKVLQQVPQLGDQAMTNVFQVGVVGHFSAKRDHVVPSRKARHGAHAGEQRERELHFPQESVVVAEEVFYELVRAFLFLFPCLLCWLGL